MQPWDHPVPPVLYKYLPPERLHVLSDCRVRFSQITAFEDDHELQPDYAIFGTQSEIWRYAISIGFQLSRNGLPASVTVAALAENPTMQSMALEGMRRGTTVRHELGSFCLTEVNDCDRMWTEYGGNGMGFIVGFATSHARFGEVLKSRGSLGKMSYSDVPFGSALGALEHEGAGVMFRKRMKYAFEREWRVIRLLTRLERTAHDVFLSAFDPASVHEIIIRPDCAVETSVRQLGADNPRYKHVSVILQGVKPG